MSALKVVYAQPRPATYDRDVVIFERREQVFDDGDEEIVKKEIDALLREGYVRCNKTTYHRTLISIQPFYGLPQVSLLPKVARLLMDESYVLEK